MPDGDVPRRWRVQQIDAVAAVLKGKLVEPYDEYEVAALIFDAIGAPV